MPTTATLLLREETPASLSALVEKSQRLEPPLPEFELRLTSAQLELIRLRPASAPDEGFESDIESIVSSDSGSSSSANELSSSKTPAETDSANGSAGSDSDTDSSEPLRTRPSEICTLVDCACYTDVTYPHVLVFVVRQREALVFHFDRLNELKNFHVNFAALKAVATNQKTTNNSAKFNLLQRTDSNGITHIEITRDTPHPKFEAATSDDDSGRLLSSIVSLNTPDHAQKLVTKGAELRKVWCSPEENVPKRPERRKKPAKGRAPPPPDTATNLSRMLLDKLTLDPPQPQRPQNDVMRGEYVRVNVNVDTGHDFIAKGKESNKKSKQKVQDASPVWTNSVPRLLKKHRSRSETRNFTPMAYRYIDTTPTYNRMGNRLFGLSPMLRDFSGGIDSGRWSSTGELRSIAGEQHNNLKSVIKNKEESSKKKEKKVTFSAYATVQVV